jgi:hypothetical protein
MDLMLNWTESSGSLLTYILKFQGHTIRKSYQLGKDQLLRSMFLAAGVSGLEWDVFTHATIHRKVCLCNCNKMALMQQNFVLFSSTMHCVSHDIYVHTMIYQNQATHACAHMHTCTWTWGQHVTQKINKSWYAFKLKMVIQEKEVNTWTYNLS